MVIVRGIRAVQSTPRCAARPPRITLIGPRRGRKRLPSFASPLILPPVRVSDAEGHTRPLHSFVGQWMFLLPVLIFFFFFLFFFLKKRGHPPWVWLLEPETGMGGKMSDQGT